VYVCATMFLKIVIGVYDVCLWSMCLIQMKTVLRVAKYLPTTYAGIRLTNATGGLKYNAPATNGTAVALTTHQILYCI